MRLRFFLCFLLLPALLLQVALLPSIHAQSEDDTWVDPSNLSRSGAAEQSRIVGTGDGRVQVFWWDRFDGIMTAVYDGTRWSDPQNAPILELAQNGMEYVSAVTQMPYIIGDAAGWAHAFWIGKAEEDGATPLWHSAMGVGSNYWSAPQPLAESAVAFDVSAAGGDGIGVAYIRNVQNSGGAAGVYFRGSAGGSAGWGNAVALYTTTYFRLLTPDQAYVRISDSGDGTIQAAWAEPHLNLVLYSRSGDDGVNWSAPEALGSAEQYPARPRVFSLPGGTAVRMWESGGGCALYQQEVAVTAAPTATWSAAEQVLDSVTYCPQGELSWMQGNNLLWLWGQGTGGLTLAAWDRDQGQWSVPKELGVSFQDPGTGDWTGLGNLQAAVAGETLWVAGEDGASGDVWAVRGQPSGLQLAWVPPSAWSEPAAVYQGSDQPDLPAVAADGEGRVHLLWSETSAEGEPGTALFYSRFDGQNWTTPSAVLSAEEGPSRQPALVAWGDRLYAAWSGGPSGEILFSQAYTNDAYASSGWSDPFALPMAGASGAWPQLVVDLYGRLHLLYAVPLNEGRGIYYTRSDDGGTTWTEAAVVFDAAAARWTMVDHPALAVDERGAIHTAWVRSPLPGNGLPDSLYYARSTDSGKSWSEPTIIAEGNYDRPRLAATLTGQVHLFWNEVDGRTAAHQRWSSDGGETWSQDAQVRGFEQASSPLALAVDGAGRLYLLAAGAGEAGNPVLAYAAWDGERWGAPESIAVPISRASGHGTAATVQNRQGKLSIVFPGVQRQSGAAVTAVWYLERSVEPVEALPAPAFTPEPSPTPIVPTPAPAPTERPAVNVQAPEVGTTVVAVGPVALPVTAIAGVGVAVLLVGGMLVGQGTRARKK